MSPPQSIFCLQVIPAHWDILTLYEEIIKCSADGSSRGTTETIAHGVQKEATDFCQNLSLLFGTPDWIRTSGLQSRSYQAVK